MRLAYRDVGKGRDQDAEAFLLAARPQECIAREGNASPAKTGQIFAPAISAYTTSLWLKFCLDGSE